MRPMCGPIGAIRFNAMSIAGIPELDAVLIAAAICIIGGGGWATLRWFSKRQRRRNEARVRGDDKGTRLF